ncbi:glycogen debranching N-terminal domain-containing protein [Labedella endophytica]|uniref:Amylo-alpha-1,6-glucosidase n=1 Tax=Labedella endophytica TaxID=1523160 RepID=A0A433JTY0_9MICO|nr:glycogen debranching N-terminal domain-containing protein [Labedella endophytica]RUR01545.1 amylo-alpha-1,6-glucosidase [Labedella endophytica]
MTNASDVSHAIPRQPLLNDSVIALRAPTQVWSARSGDMGASAIDGVYHGDVRFLRRAVLTYDGHLPEWISVSPDGPSRVVFGGLLREIDDRFPDPQVRILRERTVADGEVNETISVESALAAAVRTTVRLTLTPDFASLTDVKSGAPRPGAVSLAVDSDAVRGSSGDMALEITTPDAHLEVAGEDITLSWEVELGPRERVELSWRQSLTDPGLVVRGVTRDTGWDVHVENGDPRLERWVQQALGDLDALRLALPDHPEDEFFAAGAPWFFTLFGRDSLWAARMMLPVDWRIAASTLRVLARLQGTEDEPSTAEQPGKILHELRGAPVDMPGEGILLPPVYYGTVDATPLWVCLLSEAWAAGMPDDEVRSLLPTLRAALDWLLHHGDSDGDGFIDYIDTTGHGLANQGWKDSGDSIQWRDGSLAEGPIALSEVQGYAYEAALAGADVLDRLGEPGGSELRDWAAALKTRFAEAYWVQTPEGRYPGIALDAHKRPVDTLTSNIGHLLGTGILDADDEAHVAALLVGPSMLSGFGLRTMSTQGAGYWPMSYHGGSVWTHDSAIVAHGMSRAGRHEEARLVVDGLLAAAEGFAFRMPELHSGDAAEVTSVPTPYPAACRPQAWSAAAAITAMDVTRRRGAAPRRWSSADRPARRRVG